MKLQSKIGPLIICLFLVLTLSTWFFVRQGTSTFNSYSTATHSLGQLAGLVGMTLFALSLALTTRARWIERLFGGLDKVYKTHHRMGVSTFVLLLFHPLLLVFKFIPSDIKRAATSLLPSDNWAVNFGIITLITMALLIILTLYVKMKYPNWKFSHKFMGAVYVFAVLHVFLVDTDITYYPLLRNYMIFVTAIGGVSYLFGSFVRPYLKKKTVYRLKSIETRGKITLIELSPIKEKIMFESGQFAFIRFPEEKEGREQHPFTIASSPLSENLTFAIKDLGDYTSKINTFKKGTIVEIEGPYGNFIQSNENLNSKQIWFAGGIGITPFLSMADHLEKSSNSKVNITLYYCVREKSEAVFLNELNKMAKKVHGLKITPWYSNKKGVINLDSIEEKNDLHNVSILICGPPQMSKALYDQCLKKGISKANIYREDFNFRWGQNFWSGLLYRFVLCKY